MKPEEIKQIIFKDASSAFGFLRDEDYRIRLTAFDSYISLLVGNEQGHGTISDFVEIVGLELIPQMGDSKDVIQSAALSHILNEIGRLAVSMTNPSPLISLIDVITGLIDHTNHRTATSARISIGLILKALPEELSIERAHNLLRMLDSQDPFILQASVIAWGEISTTSPEKGIFACPRMFELLLHESPEVRNEVVGYFYILSGRMPSECAFALPILREIRDGDSDSRVAERAAATIQVISRL